MEIIDTGLYGPERTAAYLINRESGATIFDTGARSSVPTILASLAKFGVAPGQVTTIVLSHVHLDHAGGAGALMASCPKATLIVHPKGARHMADPSKLEASARQVYGDHVFEETFGSLVPIASDRMITVEDGQQIGGFRFFDAPGHAYHHLIMLEIETGDMFVGDAFGLAYPGVPVAIPSTSPTQFDPEAAAQTYRKIQDLGANRIAIAHFGVVKDPESHLRQLEANLANHVRLAKEFKDAPAIELKLQEALPIDTREPLALDCHMNALGLAHWISQPPR